MSPENVELLRRGFEAFNRGDIDAMVADMAPDCEYIAIGVVGATGVYRGPEGLKRLLSQLWDEFDDPRYEVHELIETGDRVLASVTLRGRG
jgi:hypothetical protein